MEPTDAAPQPPGTRYATPDEPPFDEPERAVKIKLASGGEQVMVEVRSNLLPEDYLDAEVRLKAARAVLPEI